MVVKSSLFSFFVFYSYMCKTFKASSNVISCVFNMLVVLVIEDIIYYIKQVFSQNINLIRML